MGGGSLSFKGVSGDRSQGVGQQLGQDLTRLTIYAVTPGAGALSWALCA
jgi:hypothetical protein